MTHDKIGMVKIPREQTRIALHKETNDTYIITTDTIGKDLMIYKLNEGIDLTWYDNIDFTFPLENKNLMYKYYNGDIYQLLGFGIIAEDNSDNDRYVVIYRDRYDSIYITPIHMFFEYMKKYNQCRFQIIDNIDDIEDGMYVKNRFDDTVGRLVYSSPCFSIVFDVDDEEFRTERLEWVILKNSWECVGWNKPYDDYNYNTRELEYCYNKYYEEQANLNYEYRDGYMTIRKDNLDKAINEIEAVCHDLDMIIKNKEIIDEENYGYSIIDDLEYAVKLLKTNIE